MSISLDLQALDAYFARGPLYAIWIFFMEGGWIFVAYMVIRLAWFFWVFSRQKKFVAKWSFVLLAIDVPRENEQATKAVENIFTSLAGIRSSGDFIDKYWSGKIQESLSFEICSSEGYIQFFARVPTHFRDVVEAAIYAQYPDAEIREVPDYTEIAPELFPSEEYELWGADIILANDSAYPIKTYPFFEDALSQELKDPMAALLENFSRLGKGEHLWFQIIVVPTDSSWKASAEKLVKKLVGAKVKSKKNFLDKALDIPMKTLTLTSDVIFGAGELSGHPEKPEPPSIIQFLTKGEQAVIEAIQKKIAKIGFLVKLRVVYLAKKEVYQPAKAVSGFLGSLQQFSTLDMNGFRPHGILRTARKHIFHRYRVSKVQNRLLTLYRKRAARGGGMPYILNTEELATIYHFPQMTVKAAAVKKAAAKKVEAPFTLPMTYEHEIIPSAMPPMKKKDAQPVANREPEIEVESVFLREDDTSPEEEKQENEPPIRAQSTDIAQKNPPRNLPL